jgi:hypothetical protein
MPTLAEIDTELSLLSGPVRAAYAEAGSHVGSDVTRKVGERIIEAHELHGALVGPQGFLLVMFNRLKWAVASIIVADAHRDGLRIEKKAGTAGLKEKLKTGKTQRLALRALLRPVPSLLRSQGGEEPARLATHIETVLSQTSSAGGNPRVLGGQLDQLNAELDRPEVKAVVGADGAEARLVAARAAALALHALTPRRSGTPIDSERLDVLDGIVIELVRQARAAARVAASLTGNQALAQAYAIDDLLG